MWWSAPPPLSKSINCQLHCQYIDSIMVQRFYARRSVYWSSHLIQLYCKNCTWVMLLLIPSILRGNYWGESRSWLSSWCKMVSPICVTQWEVIIEVGRGGVKSSFITSAPCDLSRTQDARQRIGPRPRLKSKLPISLRSNLKPCPHLAIARRGFKGFLAHSSLVWTDSVFLEADNHSGRIRWLREAGGISRIWQGICMYECMSSVTPLLSHVQPCDTDH